MWCKIVLPFLFSFSVSLSSRSVQSRIADIYVTGYGKTDHFAHNFKIELLVFKGSVDLKQ